MILLYISIKDATIIAASNTATITVALLLLVFVLRILLLLPAAAANSMAYGSRRFNAVPQGPSNNPILTRINLIPPIDAYSFKIHSNVFCHLRLGLLGGHFRLGYN